MKRSFLINVTSYILFFITTCFPYNTFAQVGIIWQRCFGLGFSSARSIESVSSGGYVLAGYSYCSLGGPLGSLANFYITRLNEQGDSLWSQCYGGSGWDRAYDIKETSDNGFIVVGSTESNDFNVSGNHGGSDFWVIKLDHLGILEWQKCLGGSGNDVANSVSLTTDGGSIVSGYTESTDGDITSNNGSRDYWIVKLNSIGDIQWQRCYGGSSIDESNSIISTNDGGYITAGSTQSNNGDVSGNHGPLDFWLAKLDSLGTIQWQKCLGGSGDDVAYSLRQAADGGYIVAGKVTSSNGDITCYSNSGWDIWVVKLDNSGSIQWSNCFGGTSSPPINNQFAYSIRQSNDGGFIIAGSSYNIFRALEYYIIKIDALGNLEFHQEFGMSTANNDEAFSICQAPDGSFVVAGSGGFNGCALIGGVMKLNIPTSINTITTLGNTVEIYPNPASNFINVKYNSLVKGPLHFSILNHLGQVVLKDKITESNLIFTIDLPNGMYYAKIESLSDTKYIKLIISSK